MISFNISRIFSVKGIACIVETAWEQAINAVDNPLLFEFNEHIQYELDKFVHKIQKYFSISSIGCFAFGFGS